MKISIHKKEKERIEVNNENRFVCPNCQSDNIQSYALVWQHGVSNTSSTTAGIGFAGGETGLGAARTKRDSVSAMAQTVAPPKKKGYLKWVFLSWGIGALAANIIGGTTGPVLGIVIMGICLYIFAYRMVYQWNKTELPKLVDEWNHSYNCNKCGHHFLLRSGKVPIAKPRFGIKRPWRGFADDKVICERGVSDMPKMTHLGICIAVSVGLVLGTFSLGYAMQVASVKYVETKPNCAVRFDNDGDKIDIINQVRQYGRMTFFYPDGVKTKSIVIDLGYTLLDWSIRQITTVDPEMRLIEVTVTGGNRAVAYGYWLIGIHDGNLVTFVSPESLYNMGCHFGPAYDEFNHRLFSEVKDGKLILKYLHIIEHEYGYQRETIVDNIIQLDWDANARWFSLKNI